MISIERSQLKLICFSHFQSFFYFMFLHLNLVLSSPASISSTWPIFGESRKTEYRLLKVVFKETLTEKVPRETLFLVKIIFMWFFPRFFFLLKRLKTFLFFLADAPTLVDVNIFIRSFSNIDDVKMVSGTQKIWSKNLILWPPGVSVKWIPSSLEKVSSSKGSVRLLPFVFSISLRS